MMKHSWILSILFAVVIDSCKDMGSNVPLTPPTTSPQIVSIQPDSAFIGDTLMVIGTNFGGLQGTSILSVGGTIADTVFLWSDTEIQAKIPARAVSGAVIVRVGGTASNSVPYTVRGTFAPTVSFANDVLAVFKSSGAGCTGCHGGQNNLYLDSYDSLMSGNSFHGPVVTKGDGEGSVIIKKLRGTAGFGVRMPFGGQPLNDTTIAKISLWITQGARNN
jgi:hypothetical protein